MIWPFGLLREKGDFPSCPKSWDEVAGIVLAQSSETEMVLAGLSCSIC